MNTKIQRRCIFALTALFMTAVLALGGGAAVRASAQGKGVSPYAPFYDNPFDPTHCDVEKVYADGDGEEGGGGVYQMVQRGGGGSVRLFYGDYVSGGAETPYYLDLTDCTLTLTIDALAAGQSIELAFLSYVPNGSYPMHGYGQGLALYLSDDGGGNTGLTPSVRTFAYGDAGHAPLVENGNGYLVYNNVSSRPSYLGKSLQVRIFIEGDSLKFQADFLPDGTNGSAYGFRAELALSSLPANGEHGFDPTKAQFMLTNTDESGATGLTICGITDAGSIAYASAVGGMTGNTVTRTQEFRQALAALSLTAPTAAQAKKFAAAKAEFDGMDVSALRKHDRAEREALATQDLTAATEAALSVAAEVFADYSVGAEIADPEDAKLMLAYYDCYEEELSEYAELAAYVRANLSWEDVGQNAVITAIDALTEKYPEVTRTQYLTAKAEYDSVTSAYAALSAAAKKLVKNYADLEQFASGPLAEGRAAYYTTQGSYFTNEFGGEAPAANAVLRNADGSTSVALRDDAATRLVYGEDLSAGGADYRVGLSNFQLTLTVDSIGSAGRFAINFASHRSALPYSGETNPGLSVFFRMQGQSADIALAKTVGGVYPTGEEVPGIGGFGVWGSLTRQALLSRIVLRFAAEEGGVRLFVSAAGGGAASLLLPSAFLAEVFGDTDTEALCMNFTTGEGLTSFNEGKDIRLTVWSVEDGYARDYAALVRRLENQAAAAAVLAEKSALSLAEIAVYNGDWAEIDAATRALRVYEAEDFASRREALDQAVLSAVDQLAAACVRQLVEAITTPDTENFASIRQALDAAARAWDTLTEAQRKEYPGYAEAAAALQTGIENCRAARGVMDRIAEVVAESLLPQTVDALRAEYAAVAQAYGGLSGAQQALVTNYAAFLEFGARLDGYDPARSVSEAIEKLFTDFPQIEAPNRAAAEEAAAKAQAAYGELTEAQREEVENYAKLTEFNQRIEDCVQALYDLSVAGEFDLAAEQALAKFSGITAENAEAASDAADELEQAHEALTEAQQALTENFGAVAELRARVSAFRTGQEDAAAAQRVQTLISAIGEVENTPACKARIDAARAAYDALSEAQRQLVENAASLTAAETAYAAFGDSQASGGCAGCGSKEAAAAAAAALGLSLLAVFAVKRTL